MAGRRAALAAGGVVLLLLAAGGYVVADVRDVVPGPLTDAPRPTPYPPLPTAPGAVVPDAAAPVLADLPALAPADAVAVDAVLRPLVADPALGPGAAATVLDGATGQVLLDVGAQTAHEPASTAKLLTAAAVLARLGPDHVVTTRAVQGVTPDEVVLLAGGDVLMAAGAGDPLAASGRAGLGDLADATAASLLAQGRTSVVVNLDDALFAGVGTGESVGPGVVPADLTNGFVAPFTAIAVDAGRLTPGNYVPRAADPGLAAAAAFAAALAARGVTVTGTPARTTAPSDPVVLGAVDSAPLGEVVGAVLLASDNTGADALARLVAVDLGRRPTFADSGQAVLDAVAELGVPTSGLRMADGSGLSDGTVLTPAVLAGVLLAAASPDHPELRALFDDLPVAGLTGTLAERFTDPASTSSAQGLVRAKTGSLTGTTSLAGVVRGATGRLLVFAVMADQVPSTTPGREAVDRFVAGVTTCAC